jgi:hypothetical protein
LDARSSRESVRDDNVALTRHFGRLAQWESTALTTQGSEVRTLYRPRQKRRSEGVERYKQREPVFGVGQMWGRTGPESFVGQPWGSQ